jgi:hypothetical protein
MSGHGSNLKLEHEGATKQRILANWREEGRWWWRR